MAEILEVGMIICFGASWPINVLKSYRARTAKGKSPAFLLLITVGYVIGCASKLVNPTYMAQIGEKWYVLFFYVLNLLMICADLVLYARNCRLDRMRKEGFLCE